MTQVINHSSKLQQLKSQLEVALAEVYRLSCVEHELELALAARELVITENHQLHQQVDTLQNERDYARTQLQQVHADREELQKLQKWKASVLAICAIPREQLLPVQKLAWITGPEQKTYSDVIHGGEGIHQLISIKQWNAAIGGNTTNPKSTNTLNEALRPLIEGGAVKKELVDTGDGKKHYTVTFDENMLHHPRLFVKPGEPNKHNGGDKRCPNCGEPCKRNLQVSFECVKCGIDFDRDMKPIDHLHVQDMETAPMPTVSPTQEPLRFKDYMPGGKYAPTEELNEDEIAAAFGPKKAR